MYIGVARGPSGSAMTGQVLICSTLLYRRVQFWPLGLFPETFQSHATPLMYSNLLGVSKNNSLVLIPCFSRTLKYYLMHTLFIVLSLVPISEMSIDSINPNFVQNNQIWTQI